MNWEKPSWVEISLGMEVTAYVNTDGPLPLSQSASAPLPSVAPRRAADSSSGVDEGAG